MTRVDRSGASARRKTARGGFARAALAVAFLGASGLVGLAQQATPPLTTSEAGAAAQQPAPAPGAVTPPAAPVANATPSSPRVPAGVAVPGDYVIGPDDIISIVFWRDKDMTTDAVVRPDGRITLPLLNDVQAAGLTPEQLRESVKTEASKYIEDPNVTVVVKQINSRRVFVTGQVGKPGPYPISAPTTVLQLLSVAGGVNEFANSKRILIMRTENGTQKALPFNYKDVVRGKNLQQNVLLRPGDTVVVP